MKSKSGPKVSVIVPCYNSEKHIGDTVNSILNQTYKNFEIIVVDDCSTDESVSIVGDMKDRDDRISLYLQPSNQGVARARNRALEHAKGRYVAYLDSDDLWAPTKLEEQIHYMDLKSIGACFTSYETVTEDGAFINLVHVPSTVNYRQFLKNTITCSHTVMFDTQIVDKSLLRMPELKRGQDLATWLQVARAGHVFHGLDIDLAKYRKCEGSLSSNKVKAIRRTWHVYREVEHLSIPYAMWCQLWQITHAVFKRIKRRS